VFYISTIVKAKTNKSKKLIKSVVKRANCGVKLAIIPHDKNDYRPHLIRRYGLVAIIFVVIGLQLGFNGATTGNVLGRESDITINSLLDQTNQARAQIGETPLKLNSKLDKAAYLKAQDMFAKQYWAHNAPDGTPPWKWFGDVGYDYNEAGENLAKNFTSTGAVMTAWLNSPEHKANILKADYQDVGFAVVDGELDDKPTSLVVALYGMPVDSTTVGTQSSFIRAVSNSQANILAQFAIAFQSVTPAAIGGLVLIAMATVVAVLAHLYRRKLPKSLRQSWYRHHGLYKAVGLMSFSVIVIFLYGGGQI
jgi:hypothetical protein